MKTILVLILVFLAIGLYQREHYTSGASLRQEVVGDSVNQNIDQNDYANRSMRFYLSRPR